MGSGKSETALLFDPKKFNSDKTIYVVLDTLRNDSVKAKVVTATTKMEEANMICKTLDRLSTFNGHYNHFYTLALSLDYTGKWYTNNAINLMINHRVELVYDGWIVKAHEEDNERVYETYWEEEKEIPHLEFNLTSRVNNPELVFTLKFDLKQDDDSWSNQVDKEVKRILKRFKKAGVDWTKIHNKPNAKILETPNSLVYENKLLVFSSKSAKRDWKHMHDYHENKED